MPWAAARNRRKPSHSDRWSAPRHGRANRLGDHAVSTEKRGPEGWENWRSERAGKPDRAEAAQLSLYSDSHMVGEIPDGLGPHKLINTVAGGIPPPRPGEIDHALVLRVSIHDDHESVYQRPGKVGDPESGWGKTDTLRITADGSGRTRLPSFSHPRGPTPLRRHHRLFGDSADDPRGKPVEYAHGRPPIVRPSRNRPATLPRIAGASVNVTAARRSWDIPQTSSKGCSCPRSRCAAI